MTETSIWHLNEVKVQVGSGYVAATVLEAVILRSEATKDLVKLDERTPAPAGYRRETPNASDKRGEHKPAFFYCPMTNHSTIN